MIIGSAAALLVGCAPTAEQGAPATCPSGQYAGLIGTDITTAALPLSLTYRVIYPDSVVTTDHMPDRLNVSVSDAGIVKSLSCG